MTDTLKKRSELEAETKWKDYKKGSELKFNKNRDYIVYEKVVDKAGNTEYFGTDRVVVDGNSASASEIFAGAIQDYGLGPIVGTTTYGKGIVQQIFDLGDGTCVKLTMAEYYTPNGRNIHKKGITPDVEVEYQQDENNPDADNQLDAALEQVRNKINQ